MDRLHSEMLWLECLLFVADKFLRCQVPERLEPPPEVVGINEVRQELTQLSMVVVVEAFTVASLIVRFIRSTCPLAHGCLILVMRCLIPCSSQTRPKMCGKACRSELLLANWIPLSVIGQLCMIV